jgi:hypothetical protein
VAGLLVAAFVIRLVYVDNTYYKAINDAGTYNRFGSDVARYGDYHTGSGPHTGAGGSHGQTAYFPPAFPYFLGLVDLIDGHEAGGKSAVGPDRVAMAVIGTLSVGLLGLVALEAFGGAVAVAAVAIAAVYPVFVELSGALVAENLLLVFELASIWTALRARRAGGSRFPGGVYLWIAATGVLTGLATLAHENAALFVLPLGVACWSALRARGVRGSRVRLRDDRPLDDPQRGRAAPLHPGLRRDRDHPRGDLQRRLGRCRTAALQVGPLPQAARVQGAGQARLAL